MGSSVTKQFLEDRADGNAAETIETGVWYSGFERVRKYADDNKLPFIGVWSNGDACYYCKRLEKVLMTDEFKAWMKDSGCVFWFGCSLDKSDEDKAHGSGFYWCWSDKSFRTYPFMRFGWTDGTKTVDKANSGNWWDGSKDGAAGAALVIEKLETLLDEVHSGSAFSSPGLRIRTNPDWTEEEVAEFRESIKENGGYCPCVPDKTDDSKCMCRWFREQTTEGTCHCGLYDKYYA